MRGQVHRASLTSAGPKPYVVVSNNVRNRKLDSVLAVPITTTDKTGIPTAVPLVAADPLVGFALADDIVEIFHEELASGTYLGALSAGTLLTLNTALMHAFGIP
jgi:mRNA interferase MazF